eukprot:UN33580
MNISKPKLMNITALTKVSIINGRFAHMKYDICTAVQIDEEAARKYKVPKNKLQYPPPALPVIKPKNKLLPRKRKPPGIELPDQPKQNYRRPSRKQMKILMTMPWI